MMYLDCLMQQEPNTSKLWRKAIETKNNELIQMRKQIFLGNKNYFMAPWWSDDGEFDVVSGGKNQYYLLKPPV